jgi:hypothetical protein
MNSLYSWLLRNSLFTGSQVTAQPFSSLCDSSRDDLDNSEFRHCFVSYLVLFIVSLIYPTVSIALLAGFIIRTHISAARPPHLSTLKP